MPERKTKMKFKNSGIESIGEKTIVTGDKQFQIWAASQIIATEREFYVPHGSVFDDQFDTMMIKTGGNIRTLSRGDLEWVLTCVEFGHSWTDKPWVVGNGLMKRDFEFWKERNVHFILSKKLGGEKIAHEYIDADEALKLFKD